MSDQPTKRRTKRTPEQREADLRAQLEVIAEMKRRDMRKRLESIAKEIDAVCANTTDTLPFGDKMSNLRAEMMKWLAEVSK